MNKIILTGNIANDNKSTDKIVRNSIAVRRDFKNESGEYDTDFFDIIAYGHQAYYMKNYVKKGDKVEICGRMQIRQYQTQDGINRKAYEVILDSISTLVKVAREEDLAEVNDNFTLDENYDIPF